MPTHKANHDDNRGKVCFFCTRKSFRTYLRPFELQYARRLFSDFEEERGYLPAGICGTCEKRVGSKNPDSKAKVKSLPSFGSVNYRALVQRIKFDTRNTRDHPWTAQDCECVTCGIARFKGVSQPLSEYFTPNNDNPTGPGRPTGNPPAQGPPPPIPEVSYLSLAAAAASNPPDRPERPPQTTPVKDSGTPGAPPRPSRPPPPAPPQKPTRTRPSRPPPPKIAPPRPPPPSTDEPIAGPSVERDKTPPRELCPGCNNYFDGISLHKNCGKIALVQSMMGMLSPKRKRIFAGEVMKEDAERIRRGEEVKYPTHSGNRQPVVIPAKVLMPILTEEIATKMGTYLGIRKNKTKKTLRFLKKELNLRMEAFLSQSIDKRGECLDDFFKDIVLDLIANDPTQISGTSSKKATEKVKKRGVICTNVEDFHNFVCNIRQCDDVMTKIGLDGE